ncbi:isocitrate lyase/phosphoenolpyruvate mutase family protein [Variovorax sp. E3]|uniref:isocitrate lyase/phosphoenolpyruvate mutase family protein n=1 Tax=Variovorax sp. E3 TaxID=1914993 RepID=UPI0022B6C3B8|nr:isocitrate lyase/phosphoenolpyruvate mutase family protein [Variovorax sp. E3]
MHSASGHGRYAIQLEDQTLPMRCRHLDGKTLVAEIEMIGKIKAAVDAGRSADALIVAHTDAVVVEGLSAALDRGGAPSEAGADILFVEALWGADDMSATFATLGGRLMLENTVEGEKTLVLPAAQLQKIGYSVVIYPGRVDARAPRTTRNEDLLARL